MALGINQNNEVIYLQGNINSTNTSYVKQHIKYVMNSYRDLKLDIGKVDSIDFDGISCLKSIQDYATKNFRKLMIVNGDKYFNIKNLKASA